MSIASLLVLAVFAAAAPEQAARVPPQLSAGLSYLAKAHAGDAPGLAEKLGAVARTAQAPGWAQASVVLKRALTEPGAYAALSERLDAQGAAELGALRDAVAADPSARAALDRELAGLEGVQRELAALPAERLGEALDTMMENRGERPQEPLGAPVDFFDPRPRVNIRYKVSLRLVGRDGSVTPLASYVPQPKPEIIVTPEDEKNGKSLANAVVGLPILAVQVPAFVLGHTHPALLYGVLGAGALASGAYAARKKWRELRGQNFWPRLAETSAMAYGAAAFGTCFVAAMAAFEAEALFGKTFARKLAARRASRTSRS